MAKPYSASTLRGVGHPWNGDDPHWDMLIIKAINDDVLLKLEERAEKVGWRMLSTGWNQRDPASGEPTLPDLAVAIFYRPQTPGYVGAQKGDWVESTPNMWPNVEDW